VAISGTITALTGGGLLFAIFVFPSGPPTDPNLETVNVRTKPPGANIALIPLDEITGEPQPERIVHAGSVSPVEVKLLPGDYLVVAHFNDIHFQEEYRHVPSDLEGIPFKNIFLWFERLQNGVIQWHEIAIPEPSIIKGMVLIPGSTDFRMGTLSRPQRYSVPGFYIDPHEFTVGEYVKLDGLRPRDEWVNWIHVPDDHAARLDWCRAMACAARLGKRLPSEVEFEYLATAAGTRRYPWGNAIPEEAKAITEIGPVGTPTFDRLDTVHPVFGLCSNVAEWTSTWGSLAPLPGVLGGRLSSYPGSFQIVRGGDDSIIEGSGVVSAETRNPRGRHEAKRNMPKRGLGVRFARSAKPRLRPDDFVRVIGE
jgi:formylglycine-generating enzyme required for sulfatase activity